MQFRTFLPIGAAAMARDNCQVLQGAPHRGADPTLGLVDQAQAQRLQHRLVLVHAAQLVHRIGDMKNGGAFADACLLYTSDAADE